MSRGHWKRESAETAAAAKLLLVAYLCALLQFTIALTLAPHSNSIAHREEPKVLNQVAPVTMPVCIWEKERENVCVCAGLVITAATANRS